MNLRGKLLLVSAAAGSGKTSVLTERIIRTLTDPEHPADLSRLLVVTFTRAAAAELKARIASALTEALAERPGDLRLSRQLLLLGSAQISTIDSFFQQAVRANFEQLGLPASFRMAEEKEAESLCLGVLNEVIQEFYHRYEPPADATVQSTANAGAQGPFAPLQGNRFAELMDNLLTNRSDADFDRNLLDFMRNFSAYPEGFGLLRSCADDLRRAAEGDFFLSRAGKSIHGYLTDAFGYYLQELRETQDYLDTDDDAAAYFSGAVASDADFCRRMLRALESRSYEEARGAIFTYQRQRFPTMRGKPPQMERYKKLRESLRDAAEDLREKLFGWSPEQLREQLLGTAALCDMLAELFSVYHDRVLEEKQARGILEFDDVREALYRLLTLPDGSPSSFAQSLADRYDAVYIDEYQDVDFLQDRIFSLIGGNRRFMVGDIKQSIYGFRGSEPAIFAGYRRSMPLASQPEAAGAEAACVFMSENFRCDRPVTDYANRVCSFLFSACEESVGYRPQDDLVCAKPAPDRPGWEPAPVQTLLFEPYSRRKSGEAADAGAEPGERPRREAVWVAAEIARLLREEQKDDGSRLTPSDIAILVRNGAHGTEFARELEKLEIPVCSPSSGDLLHSPLMTDTLNLLRAIDNPYRDLPLSEYLLTPQGGFTLEELTSVREAAPDRKALYDALTAAAQMPEHPCGAKAAAWVEWLEGYRQLAAVQPADRLLRLLYLDPRLSDCAAEPELLLLYEQARVYQRSAWNGLYGFLDHFSKLLGGATVAAGGLRREEDAVHIMTIHHSKGLEFPVVFLCGCGNRFNTDSLQGNPLFHRRAGFACKLYNPDTKENENTILREAVRLEMAADQTEENIRTLYVALTRARERMYVTGTLEGKLDSALASAAMMRRGSRYSILSAGSNLRWILAALQDSARDVGGTAGGAGEFPCTFRYIPLSEPIGEDENGARDNAAEHLSDHALPAACRALSEAASGCPGTGGQAARGLNRTMPEDAPADAVSAAATGESDLPRGIEAEFRNILERQNGFHYPLDMLHGIPTKAAASKLRPDLLDRLTGAEDDTDDSGRADDEALEIQISLMQRAVPAFDTLLDSKRKPSAADIGTATHSFLEYCDLKALPARGITAEVERLVDGRFLSPDAAAILNTEQLEAFAGSDLMRMISEAVELHREQKFNLLLPLCELTSRPDAVEVLAGQTIFVQGSIDLLLRMPDGRLLLIDYKTDRITEEERRNPALLQADFSERHGHQLACYARAVTGLYGSPPDAVFIYSLPLGRCIPIALPGRPDRR